MSRSVVFLYLFSCSTRLELGVNSKDNFANARYDGVN